MYSSLILAVSNLFGLSCLNKAINNKEINSFIVIYLIIISSFLMHLTESKHDYIPFIFIDYSYFFLWIDRIITAISILYFLPIYIKKDRDSKRFVNILGIFGLFCLYAGETKTNDEFFNYIVYPFLHLIWHACIYISIYIVI